MTQPKKRPTPPQKAPKTLDAPIAHFAPGADPLLVQPPAVTGAPALLARFVADPAKYDPAAAAAHLDALRPRLAAIAPERVALARLDVNAAAQAGLAAHALLTQVAPLHARYAALAKAGEADLATLELVPTAAFALLYASHEAKDAGAFASEAKLSAKLDEESAKVEREMQAVCEHNFADHPVHGDTLARLRPGTSYDDRAHDLLGYAKLYEAEHATVSKDTRYRATHVADARRLAGEILAALGLAMTPKAREMFDLAQRAFTLLAAAYAEVAAVGGFLLRADPRVAERFPSLFSVGRLGVGRKRGGKAAGGEAGVDAGGEGGAPATGGK